MPRRRDRDSSHSEKLLRLFARLFFSGRAHSLTELSELLGCSKQTVQRLVDDIERSLQMTVEIERVGNRNFYRIPHRRKLPPASLLSTDELHALHMCRAFAEKLLGRDDFEDATRGLEKTAVLLPLGAENNDAHFASVGSGSIDYTPHQDTLRMLIDAMEQRMVCRIRYRRLLGERAKTFRIKPLKICSHRDTVYVHARRAKDPGHPYKVPSYDPLLAVHRIESIEITDTPFSPPRDYDFDKAVRRNFGVWQNEPFRVTVRFTGWAAQYVAERTWAADQSVQRRRGGAVDLSFTARGEPELISWVMSFGANARLLAPDELVARIRDDLDRVQSLYD